MRTHLVPALRVLYTSSVRNTLNASQALKQAAAIVKLVDDEIIAGFTSTGWSVQEFLDKSGLVIDRSSLDRKLKRLIPFQNAEREVLVQTLRKHGQEITVVLPSTKHRAA